MLALFRRKQEAIHLITANGETITIRADRNAKLLIEAPRSVQVYREEVLARAQATQATRTTLTPTPTPGRVA